MKKMMWKVIKTESFEYALFENKGDAEMFVKILEEKDITASLNIYKWEVNIED
ncbi:hypothetical protein HMPREF1143_0096 [Peptoanaerobacter stomatis]|uniref:Uncharacterized protein n=1 Tax=Peptoanaerobacter stomatis TaxID=796937 RepID=J5U7D1_9FIRM|nr:hypothetical protein [Peptoanaerobacter stomatis]EJU20364.1 hypothetical protein HMPREF1143_0096 [Peptoanaerobacter stomatis]